MFCNLLIYVNYTPFPQAKADSARYKVCVQVAFDTLLKLGTTSAMLQ